MKEIPEEYRNIVNMLIAEACDKQIQACVDKVRIYDNNNLEQQVKQQVSLTKNVAR